MASLATSGPAAAQNDARACSSAIEARLPLETLRREYGRKQDRLFDLGPFAVRYRDEGTGPAVVLLHGSYASLDSLDGLARGLARDHRVVRFDMPNMGLSDSVAQGEEGRFAYADQILEALLGKLGIDKVLVIGVSSGGTLGYFYAAHHPDQVRGLVLANAPSDVLHPEEVPRSPELLEARRRVARTGFEDCAYWQTYLRWLAAVPERVSDTQVRCTYDMNRRILPAKAHRFWRSTNDQTGVLEALAHLEAPTLLVWGEVDAVLPLSAMTSLAEKITRLAPAQVPMRDVGHYPPMEVPGRFAALVRGWEAAILPD